MIKAKDAVVLAAMAWFLLRDRESTNVNLTQTCIDGDGNRVTVPLGDCPPGTILEIVNDTPPYTPPFQLGTYAVTKYGIYSGLGGCGCGGGCAGCR